MRSLSSPGFRAWSNTEVAEILSGIETAMSGVLTSVPDSSERRAYVAGARTMLAAIYAGFGLRPNNGLHADRAGLAGPEVESH